MIIRVLVCSAILLVATFARAQSFFLDCTCLSTQSVLITNACQAVVPDLCQFTNCFGSTVVPAPLLFCSQSPPPGTPVGPGIHPVTVTVSDQSGVNALSCVAVFQVIPPATGCNFTLLCASNKTVECDAVWTFDPPTWVNACIPPLGTPSNGVLLVVVSTVTNGTCPQVIKRTWQAVDDCMHVDMCMQTVTVVDSKPPSLDCRCLTNNAALPPIPLTVTNCTGVIPDFCQYALLCAADNCGPITCTQSPPAGTLVGPGVHPLTVTVLDCASNAVSCSLNFTVIAPALPGPFALLCGANKTVECGSNWSFDPPVATNYCCPPPGVAGNGVTIAIVSTTTNGACPWAITRTWRAVDACGNIATCSQTVTVADTTPPVLNCSCLRDFARTVLRTNDCSQGIVPDLCRYANCFVDLCGPISCSQTPVAGTVVGVGTHPITVTVTDCAGNQASCTLPFRVEPIQQTNSWNTGMSGGVALAPGTPDPGYVLVSAPPGGCLGPAQVLNPATLPVGPWIPNGPNSQWIGAGPSASCQPGVYHYRLCFYLPCTDGASVIGQWAADDVGEILLNGQPAGHTIPSPQFPNLPLYGWFPVNLTNGFVCGTNCLDFYVTNAAGGINPTGFRAELTNVFNDCCCPPPQPFFTVLSGMDPVGGALAPGAADPQFSLTCAPPGVSLTTPVAVVPHPNWLPNGPNSQWIGVDPSNDGPPGVYCYTLQFTLPCPPGVPFNARLTGQWTADDWASLHLNGQPTGHTVPSVQFPNLSFAGWHPINITSGFVPGVNTLTFYVTNAGGPTGLRLELTGAASCCLCTNTCVVSIQCPTNIIRNICGTQGQIAYPVPTASNSCSVPIASVVCVPPPGVFPLGTNLVTCTATDAVGNQATCRFQVIVLPDITPPVLDCTCLQASVFAQVRACAYTVPNLCVYTSCFSDDCTPAGQLLCTQSPAAGTILPGGNSYVITVTITDAAGNSAQCQVFVNVIAPAETRVWNTGMGGPSGNVPLAPGTVDPNFKLVGTPPAICSGPPKVLGGGPGVWLPDGPLSKWIGPIPSGGIFCPQGIYHYQLKFVLPCTNGASLNGRLLSDDQGMFYLNNQLLAVSSSYNVWTPVSTTTGFVPGTNVIDIILTNVPCCTGLRVELTNNYTCCCPEAIALKCPTLGVRGWVCNPNVQANVPYTVTASSLCPVPGVTTSVTCVPPSPGPFPFGSTLVNCTATDSLGNIASCSFPVTVVVDTTPPVITCPQPMTFATCQPSVTANYKAVARDDCAPNVTVTCVPPSGSSFNAGTINTVTCTASDACGNTASCSFTVTVINNLVWQAFPKGVADCYAGTWEATAPGAILNATYPGAVWKAFDNPNVNAGVGVTWLGLPNNAIGASLSTRMTPVWCHVPSGTENDSFSLGLPGVGGPWLWSRYIGTTPANGVPGLLNTHWCDQTNNCQYSFAMTLTSLPVVSGPSVNLLPLINSSGRLDMLVQDDTRVDYATLWLRRCLTTPNVFGGFPAELANARLVRGPVGVWCIIRDNPANPAWTARVAMGSPQIVAQPMSYRCKPVEWDLKTSTRFLDDSGTERTFAGFHLSHDAGSPVSVLRMAAVPEGVTELEVILLENGIPISTRIVPASTTEVLAEFDADTEFQGVLFSRPEGFWDYARGDGHPGDQLCVRFLPEPVQVAAFSGMDLEGQGIDVLDLGSPQVGHVEKEYSVGAVGDVLATAGGSGIALSPIDPDGGASMAIEYRRLRRRGLPESSGQEVASRYAPTNELTAYIEPILNQRPGGTNTNSSVRFVAVATFSDGQSRPLPKVRFASAAEGFSVTALGDTGLATPIPSVEVWDHATLVARVANPASIQSETLPLLYRVSSSPWLVEADICHRFPWNKRETVRINGTAYPCTELRVNLPSGASTGASVAGLVGLDIEASGVDALALDRVVAGPVPLRFHPPLRFTDPGTGASSDLFISWDQPWPLLEAAPSVLGPWLPVATDGTEVNVTPSPNHRYFRLRE